MKKLLFILCLFSVLFSEAQVKIGTNPNTIDANSLLELESADKGFLPPRVALNNLALVSPLTGTVPAGMLVFSSGGSLSDGYYYWSGTAWKKIGNGEKNLVTKTANATLTKTENLVMASNDITLTLPAVTAADNGMEMTIKNMGTHTDLITIVGNGGATIDGLANSKLTRYVSKTYIVSGSNWIINDDAKNIEDHILDVDESSSWTSIQQAIDFLNLHMTGPVVIRLADEDYSLSETVVINLPYAVTIQGVSFSSATISAASGLSGKPMFRCLSDVYFKMLNFDATTLVGYGDLAGEDAIRLIGDSTYNEIKDCSFDGFNTTILDSTNAELWVFECDIANAKANGILLHSAVAGAIVKVAETDFISCKIGVNFDKGSNATIQLASGVYYMANATDTAIVYRPVTFTSFTDISITGNSWNNIGKYIEGFDFTRTDGRDANANLQSNAGMGDKKPYCFINKINNSSSTVTISTANTWYKANWGTNTNSTTCKWTIVDNKITYQPLNIRNGIFSISGDIQVNNNNRVISIGIVKNGITTTRYGETTLRITTANQPFQFSFLAFLEDIADGDYFEIYYTSSNSNDILKIEDIQWLVTTQ